MKAKKEMLERHVIDGAGVYVGAGVGLPRACCVHESRAFTDGQPVDPGGSVSHGEGRSLS